MERDDNSGVRPAAGASEPGDGRPPGAWRLTFEYENDQIRLVSRQRVAMLAPPDDSALLERGRAGYWVEVWDRHGRAVYSQVLHDPIRTDYEVFSPEPGAIPRRVEAPEVKGVFQAVVPDLPEGTDVVIHGGATRRELAEQPARELIRTSLHETPPGKEKGR